MTVLIGAVYVWALYGLVFALIVFHLLGTFGPFLGVAFALGLARLAQRHSPKKLAWGVLGPNPGWAVLLYFIIFLIKPGQPDLSGEDHAVTQVFVWFFAFGASIGVVATFLCLGLKPTSTWGKMLEYFWLIDLFRFRLNRTSQIVLGAVLSGLFGTGLKLTEGFLFGWTPSRFETYALLGLSLAGIVWALSNEETGDGTATV